MSYSEHSPLDDTSDQHAAVPSRSARPSAHAQSAMKMKPITIAPTGVRDLLSRMVGIGNRLQTKGHDTEDIIVHWSQQIELDKKSHCCVLEPPKWFADIGDRIRSFSRDAERKMGDRRITDRIADKDFQLQEQRKEIEHLTREAKTKRRLIEILNANAVQRKINAEAARNEANLAKGFLIEECKENGKITLSLGEGIRSNVKILREIKKNTQDSAERAKCQEILSRHEASRKEYKGLLQTLSLFGNSGTIDVTTEMSAMLEFVRIMRTGNELLKTWAASNEEGVALLTGNLLGN